MRTFIIVAVIFHLGIIIVEINGYTFGDIISFPRKCLCKKGKMALYKHYAVYVGPGIFPNQGDNDIFHRTGRMFGAKDCVFGKLADEGRHEDGNYLDKKGLNKSSDEDIKKHIEAVLQNCLPYHVIKNNCEHLATYVRYGHAFSKQPGTLAAIGAWFNGMKEKPCPEWDKIMEEMEKNARIEDECSTSCTQQNGCWLISWSLSSLSWSLLFILHIA